jgi:hypothetical protein
MKLSLVGWLTGDKTRIERTDRACCRAPDAVNLPVLRGEYKRAADKFCPLETDKPAKPL